MPIVIAALRILSVTSAAMGALFCRLLTAAEDREILIVIRLPIRRHDIGGQDCLAVDLSYTLLAVGLRYAKTAGR